MVLVFCCGYGLANAAITTEIDPPKVRLGEPFRLTITMDNAQAGGVPDLSPLQRDFTITSTERSSAYTIINGQARSVSQWSVLLLAKKTGVVDIPPIQIGQEQSAASTIEVTEESAPAAPHHPDTPDTDVMLKTEVSNDQPFVNQQVIYTVKLYNRQRLLDAEYQPPGIEDALLIPLGDGRRYQTTEQGRAYHVEEQTYAVFPQKSGDLQINPPAFNALVYDTIPRRVNVRGEPIKLAVKSMPVNYTGKHWLPAKQITLSEDYDKPASTLLQGTTLERTITLQAVAVPAQLLPTLTFTSHKNFNVYPEKPVIHNAIKQQELIGTTRVKVTYLLNTPGSITIPKLSLTWFNSITGKEEVATLPAKHIEVEPNTGAVHAVDSSSPLAEKMPTLTDAPTQLPTQVEIKSYHYAWFLVLGFVIAWLLVFFWWWFYPRFFIGRARRLALRQLHDACESHDPVQAKAALLRWAALHWPDAKLLNLNDLAKLIHDSQLKKQLQLLSRALYSEDKQRLWRGGDLWRGVTGYRFKSSSAKSKGNGLPPINPT